MNWKKNALSTLLWILAFVIAVGTAVYQRLTGPTYPVRGEYRVDGQSYSFALKRSQGGDGGQPVVIPGPENMSFTLVWREYPTDWEWKTIPMNRNSEGLFTAELPHQPPAGKLEYYVEGHGATEVRISGSSHSVVTRFKGSVPAWVLIPHIILMFAGMTVANRAGMEALRRNGNTRVLVFVTFACLFTGGIILGCTVQNYAFGEPWTGFPVGTDLTDNKIAVALLAWLVPLVQEIRRKPSKKWVLSAALVTLIVFLIPHSALGSELDRSGMDPQ